MLRGCWATPVQNVRYKLFGTLSERPHDRAEALTRVFWRLASLVSQPPSVSPLPDQSPLEFRCRGQDVEEESGCRILRVRVEPLPYAMNRVDAAGGSASTSTRSGCRLPSSQRNRGDVPPGSGRRRIHMNATKYPRVEAQKAIF